MYMLTRHDLGGTVHASPFMGGMRLHYGYATWTRSNTKDVLVGMDAGFGPALRETDQIDIWEFSQRNFNGFQIEVDTPISEREGVAHWHIHLNANTITVLGPSTGNLTLNLVFITPLKDYSHQYIWELVPSGIGVLWRQVSFRTQVNPETATTPIIHPIQAMITGSIAPPAPAGMHIPGLAVTRRNGTMSVIGAKPSSIDGEQDNEDGDDGTNDEYSYWANDYHVNNSGSGT